MPVQLINPFKVLNGKSQAPYYEVFRIWAREIGKPGFDIVDAAKAIRLLPKCNLTGFRPRDPVFRELMDKTRWMLAQGDAGPAEVGAIIRSAAALRVRLPYLQAEVLPVLLPLVPAAARAANAAELTGMVLAAVDLRDNTPSLWKQVAPHLGLLVSNAVDVLSRDLPPLVAALGTMPVEDGMVADAMRSLQVQAVARINSFTLPELATLVWGFAGCGGVGASMQAATTRIVNAKAAKWNRRDVDPHLWRIVCAYAQLGLRDAVLLRTVARTALREQLSSLTTWGVAVLAWSYGRLAAPNDSLAAFRRQLDLEVARRRLAPELVARSELGPDGRGNVTLKLIWREDFTKRPRPLTLAPRPPLYVLRSSSLPTSQVSKGPVH